MKAQFRWVEGEHRVAITARPEPRRLERVLTAWREAGCEVVGCLMESEELRSLGLAEEPEVCRRLGMELVHFPIRDHDVPGSIDAAQEAARVLAGHARAGRGVVLHCFAGMGRSGTMGLLVLGALGVPFGEAIARLSRARGFPVPETPAQLRWAQEAFVLADSD